MTAGTHLQNIAILGVALGLAIYWNSGLPFWLLLFWLSPKTDSKDGDAK